MRSVKENIHLSASDLVNYLGCKHLTELDRKVVLGLAEEPDWNDPALAILQKKGSDHEEAYIEHLKKSGLSIIDLTNQNYNAVEGALIDGIDIIVQAKLNQGQWVGIPDILRKIKGKSKFGNYTYEVVDTKLAQITKAGTVLQLCLYSDLLSVIQQSTPHSMHVVKPGELFPTDSYLYSNFKSYCSLIKTQLEQVIANEPHSTYPLPVQKCDTCRWWKQCNKKWHEDDHLSLVAGIRNLHIKELETQSIPTLEQFALNDKPLNNKPQKGSSETYERLQGQAKVQYQGRMDKKMVYNLLPIEADRGLNRLPVPREGDIYFDIEGDRFYNDGGLEYLLGLAYHDSGKILYNKFWATNRKEEKEAFSDFISFLLDRWQKYPEFYIYHYASYEPSTVRRLASRHAIYEVEVDQLLRAERFIDLYAVIRESLQASVERYSLKDLERFTDYNRQISLQEASIARRRLDAALELNAIDRLPKQDLEIVERYNEDDCMATLELHNWVEQIYQDQFKIEFGLSRPELKSGDPGEMIEERDARAAHLRQELIKDLPDDRSSWDSEHHALWLLAHQVDYFRRELRSKWWEYFRLHDLDEEQAIDERYAIAGLVFEMELEKKGRDKNPTHRYKFPPQEISINERDAVEEIMGEPIGTVASISLEEGYIDIKKKGSTVNLHPSSIHINDVIRDTSLPHSLHQFAESITEIGLRGTKTYQAGKHLLLKENPQVQGGSLIDVIQSDESGGDAAIRISKILENSYLPIQGPPGTGKTHIGAQMIIELYLQNKRIGVTAVSHKVIRNLLDKVSELANDQKRSVEIGQKVTNRSEDTPENLTEFTINQKAFEAIDEDIIVGGTTYFWAKDEVIETLDYLFVDEAGQMSLANVLAASRSTKNLILLGDPQQLEQPQQGSHPEGSDISALDHVLDGHQTMPHDKGLFLDITWRLNPKLCYFTSELFYDNRLKPKEGLEVQAIKGKTQFNGMGLFYAPVDHEGNQNSSLEEVEKIKQIVDELTNSEILWTDRNNNEHLITRSSILIVAPYNAQVAALGQAFPDLRIGTVDKFQGQEAPVVIYSMTSSSPDDAPRGMSFLYNPNRLNVATSRSQCICILVASPKLFEPECHSIEQMRWANALCRFRDLAMIVS